MQDDSIVESSPKAELLSLEEEDKLSDDSEYLLIPSEAPANINSNDRDYEFLAG